MPERDDLVRELSGDASAVDEGVAQGLVRVSLGQECLADELATQMRVQRAGVIKRRDGSVSSTRLRA